MKKTPAKKKREKKGGGKVLNKKFPTNTQKKAKRRTQEKKKDDSRETEPPEDMQNTRARGGGDLSVIQKGKPRGRERDKKGELLVRQHSTETQVKGKKTPKKSFFHERGDKEPLHRRGKRRSATSKNYILREAIRGQHIIERIKGKTREGKKGEEATKARRKGNQRRKPGPSNGRKKQDLPLDALGRERHRNYSY